MTDSSKNKCLFIASHNGRMKCILRDLIGNDMYSNLIEVYKKGFFNCSILRIYKKQHNAFGLKLLYDGINTQNGGGKEKKPKTPFSYEDFNKIVENNDFTSDKISNLFGDDKYHEIFIIRHGDSYHNKAKEERKKSWKKKLNYNLSIDTKLTHKGIKQALNAGIYFKKYLEQKSETLVVDWEKSVFCSSILYRTAQTMALFLLAQSKKEKVINMINMNHEISSKAAKDAKKCKKPYKEGRTKIMERENYTSLTQKKDGTFYSDLKKYCKKHQVVFLTSTRTSLLKKKEGLYRLPYNIIIQNTPCSDLFECISKMEPSNDEHYMGCIRTDCKSSYNCNAPLKQELDFFTSKFNFEKNTDGFYEIEQNGGRLEYLLEKIINNNKEEEYSTKLSILGLEEEYKELIKQIKE